MSHVSGFRYGIVLCLWWGCRRPWNVLTGFPPLVDGARQEFYEQ